jgi:hypothetical protein
MRIQDVLVDEEFEGFLPPLHEDEYAALKASIEADGWTDPIVIWLNHGEIVDGYHRYKIWLELGADLDNCPDIVEKKFSDRASVMEWMFRRQMARRNWTPAQKAAVGLKMKPALELQAAAAQSAAGGSRYRQRENSLVQNSSQALRQPSTRARVAEIAGVSESTVRHTEAVLERGSEELRDAILNGNISANAAFKSLPAKPPKNGSVIKKFDETLLQKPMTQLRKALEDRREFYPGHEKQYQIVKAAFSVLFDEITTWRKLR